MSAELAAIITTALMPSIAVQVRVVENEEESSNK